MLLAVWLGGVFIFALRACIGQYRIWQIVRRAEQSPESLRNECGRVAGSIGCATPVEIVQSEKIRSPLLCGLCRPLLLLPARMCEDAYRGDLPGIFAHELTHVRCHDLLWNVGITHDFDRALVPSAGMANAQAHLAACELVCDAVSASFVGDVSRLLPDAWPGWPSMFSAACRPPESPWPGLSTISRRLNALQKRVFNVPLRRRSVLGFGLIALAAVAVLGALQFALAAPPAASAAPPAAPPAAQSMPQPRRQRRSRRRRRQNRLRPRIPRPRAG